MKKIFLLISAIALMSQFSCAQKGIKGNGNVINESRKTESYDKVTLIGSATIELIPGTEGDLTVSAESNIVPYIETIVKGNELIVRFKDDFNYSTKKEIKISVPIQEITDITLKGSGDIIATKVLNLDNLNVNLDGSGDISLNVKTNKIQADVNGSGDIDLKGTTVDFTGNVNGSGDLNSKKLITQNSILSVNGSGDIESTTTNKVDALVVGSGDILVFGNPINETKMIKGSGDITISK